MTPCEVCQGEGTLVNEKEDGRHIMHECERCHGSGEV